MSSLVLSAGVQLVLRGCELLFAVGTSINSLIILSANCVSGTEPGLGPCQGTVLSLSSLCCGVVLCNLMLVMDLFGESNEGGGFIL